VKFDRLNLVGEEAGLEAVQFFCKMIGLTLK